MVHWKPGSWLAAADGLNAVDDEAEDPRLLRGDSATAFQASPAHLPQLEFELEVELLEELLGDAATELTHFFNCSVVCWLGILLGRLGGVSALEPAPPEPDDADFDELVEPAGCVGS